MPMFYAKDGEEKKDVLDKMKPKFISQAAASWTSEDKLKKYGKTGKPLLNMPLISRTLLCYAWIAYQTAYLKPPPR
jgi:DNA polymerase-3 subunit alpha